MSYNKSFVVEESDDSDYENRVTRKPRRSTVENQQRSSYDRRNQFHDEDDEDRRSSRPKNRRNYEDDYDDDEQPRISRQGSLRRSGEGFVPRSLNENDSRGGARRPPPPATAWASGRRDEWPEPENSREEAGRSAWAKAVPKSERRESRESSSERRLSRRPSSDEEDDAPRGNRNRYNDDDGRDRPYNERPTRPPPPRVERPHKTYANPRNGNGYGEEEEEEYPRQQPRVERNENTRSRSGSNASQRYPPRGQYEEYDDRSPHHQQQQQWQQPPPNHRDQYAIVIRSDREADLTRGSTGTADDDDILSDDGNGADIIKQEHDLNERNEGGDLGGVMRLGNTSLVMLCPANGGTTDLVQCVILRDRTLGGKMTPVYKLFLENKMKCLILAQKISLSSTSNYHFFDMTRGTPGGTLSKKSGNYLGKLRAHDSKRTQYSIVTCSEAREEIGAVIFERVGIFSQFKEGCQPRKMNVLLPNLNAESEPIPRKVVEAVGQRKSMVDMIKHSETGRMFLLRSKEPVYENGNYRLNFHGRVSVPSVKNFQLSSPDDPAHVVCQFGKVGDDRFHLDYKAPLNAFQAFSLALCHFDT